MGATAFWPCRAAAAAGLVMLAACGREPTVPTPISVAEATSFIARDLPTDAVAIRAVADNGIDRLVLLRFDTSAASAAAFSRALVGGDPVAGSDPGLGYLGRGLDWWPATPPDGFAGRETRTATNRTVKLLSVPAAAGRRTVYVAAFAT